MASLLLALAVVIALGQILGRAFAFLGQPPVIGEVVAGIALGPSLLGWWAPDTSAFLFPDAIVPNLGVIAQLGVILFMFVVGLELNTEMLKAQGRAAFVISATSIATPFAMGAALAFFLHHPLAPEGMALSSFALFLGVAMAITAFPVLARILIDRGLHRSELGILALSIAALNDATAWILLALVVGVAKNNLEGSLYMVAWSLAYLAFLTMVVRPLIQALARRFPEDDPPSWVKAAVFVGLLLSALATEAIGLHALFGAFLFGALFPHDSSLARKMSHQLHELVTILFLPAFFALTGLRTRIGLVSTGEEWLICGLILLVAMAGKFGGTVIAARWVGLPWKMAGSLGILMNTRGLMELIVLNVGLDLGVISPTLFAMMVLMALATTMMTTPLLTWWGARSTWERKSEKSLLVNHSPSAR